jgi:hypothetical protein
MPGNVGSTFGKGVDMAFGKSFYDYGYGQAIGGGANDFFFFVYTGGTAGPLNNMLNNPSLINYLSFGTSHINYTSSMFHNFYGLKP